MICPGSIPAPGRSLASSTATGMRPGAPTLRFAPPSSADAPVDAWLLGHIHKPDRLAPPRPIGYLGSLTGLDPGETGPRGPWSLEFSGPEPVLEHLPLAPLRWEEVTVALDGLESEDDVPARAVAALDTLHESLAAERFFPPRGRLPSPIHRPYRAPASRRTLACGRRSPSLSPPPRRNRVFRARLADGGGPGPGPRRAGPGCRSAGPPRPKESSSSADRPETPIGRLSSPEPGGASSRWEGGAPSPDTASYPRPRRKRRSCWSGRRSGRSPSSWTSAATRQ